MATTDVRVISLQPNPPLLARVKRDFGDHAKLAPAVDTRRVSANSLVKSGLISLNAAEALEAGRKWHKELPSAGAVGLYHTNRLIMHEGKGAVLILEDDCSYDLARLKRELQRLLALGDSVDVAVFGARRVHDTETTPSDMGGGWVRFVKGGFWYAHCVFYSAAGRRKMRKYLRLQQEAQYDYYIAMLGSRGMLRVHLNHDYGIAWQSGRTTTLQTDVCLLCYLPGSVSARIGHIVLLTAMMVLLSYALFCQRYRSRTSPEICRPGRAGSCSRVARTARFATPA